jgi:chromosome segregation ATPase
MEKVSGSDSDAGKALEKLHAKEEELQQAQVAVKDLQGKLAQMSKSSATASLSLEKALKSGEVLQMKLKAAEKAGAEAEKKLASAHVRISELEAAQSAKASLNQHLRERERELQDANNSHFLQLQARAEEVAMLKAELYLPIQLRTPHRE